MGYKADRFKNFDDFIKLIHPEDKDNALNAMKRHLDGTNPKYETEYRIKTRWGNYKWFRSVGALSKQIETSDSRRVVGVIEDITLLKQSEQKNKKLIQEMGKRIKELRCTYTISKAI